MGVKRIFIVEDNDIMREMLSEFISEISGMEVCGMAETAEDALEDSALAAADLLLVDMALPEMNGADFIESVRRRLPNTPCLVLSGHFETSYVRRARAAGASGYVRKGNPQEIAEAISRVLRGEEYFR